MANSGQHNSCDHAMTISDVAVTVPGVPGAETIGRSTNKSPEIFSGGIFSNTYIFMQVNLQSFDVLNCSDTKSLCILNIRSFENPTITIDMLGHKSKNQISTVIK